MSLKAGNLRLLMEFSVGDWTSPANDALVLGRRNAVWPQPAAGMIAARKSRDLGGGRPECGLQNTGNHHVEVNEEASIIQTIEEDQIRTDTKNCRESRPARHEVSSHHAPPEPG